MGDVELNGKGENPLIFRIPFLGPMFLAAFLLAIFSFKDQAIGVFFVPSVIFIAAYLALSSYSCKQWGIRKGTLGLYGKPHKNSPYFLYAISLPDNWIYWNVLLSINNKTCKPEFGRDEYGEFARLKLPVIHPDLGWYFRGYKIYAPHEEIKSAFEGVEKTSKNWLGNI